MGSGRGAVSEQTWGFLLSEGSEALNDLPKVIPGVSGRAGNQAQVSRVPKPLCSQSSVRGSMWHSVGEGLWGLLSVFVFVCM